MPTQTYQWEGEYQPSITIRGEYDPVMVDQSVVAFQSRRFNKESILAGEVVGELEIEADWTGEFDTAGSDIEGIVP